MGVDTKQCIVYGYYFDEDEADIYTRDLSDEEHDEFWDMDSVIETEPISKNSFIFGHLIHMSKSDRWDVADNPMTAINRDSFEDLDKKLPEPPEFLAEAIRGKGEFAQLYIFTRYS